MDKGLFYFLVLLAMHFLLIFLGNSMDYYLSQTFPSIYNLEDGPITVTLEY